mmetsp:Transcript_55155/g.131429  ORF Transcript_55155/g.131429 Transcript_55155/m.131429 type:complete len:265 (-) Transcript_55155:3187-3981(-)
MTFSALPRHSVRSSKPARSVTRVSKRPGRSFCSFSESTHGFLRRTSSCDSDCSVIAWSMPAEGPSELVRGRRPREGWHTRRHCSSKRLSTCTSCSKMWRSYSIDMARWTGQPQAPTLIALPLWSRARYCHSLRRSLAHKACRIGNCTHCNFSRRQADWPLKEQSMGLWYKSWRRKKSTPKWLRQRLCDFDARDLDQMAIEQSRSYRPPWQSCEASNPSLSRRRATSNVLAKTCAISVRLSARTSPRPRRKQRPLARNLGSWKWQ